MVGKPTALESLTVLIFKMLLSWTWPRITGCRILGSIFSHTHQVMFLLLKVWKPCFAGIGACCTGTYYRKPSIKKVENCSSDQSLGYCFMPSCFCLCLSYFQMFCPLPTWCFTLNGPVCLASSDCNVILLPASHPLPAHQLFKKFLPQIPDICVCSNTCWLLLNSLW